MRDLDWTIQLALAMTAVEAFLVWVVPVWAWRELVTYDPCVGRWRAHSLQGTPYRTRSHGGRR